MYKYLLERPSSRSIYVPITVLITKVNGEKCFDKWFRWNIYETIPNAFIDQIQGIHWSVIKLWLGSTIVVYMQITVGDDVVVVVLQRDMRAFCVWSTQYWMSCVLISSKLKSALLESLFGGGHSVAHAKIFHVISFTFWNQLISLNSV